MHLYTTGQKYMYTPAPKRGSDTAKGLQFDIEAAWLTYCNPAVAVHIYS